MNLGGDKWSWAPGRGCSHCSYWHSHEAYLRNDLLLTPRYRYFRFVSPWTMFVLPELSLDSLFCNKQ